MELVLTRRWFTEESTEGELTLEGERICYTLEDRLHEGPKIPGRTAIPAGRYELALTHSPRFNRLLPLVQHVPDFSGVRIHAGNTPGDTEGCILVGEERVEDRVLRSRVALEALMDRITLPCWLTVTGTRGELGATGLHAAT